MSGLLAMCRLVNTWDGDTARWFYVTSHMYVHTLLLRILLPPPNTNLGFANPTRFPELLLPPRTLSVPCVVLNKACLDEWVGAREPLYGQRLELPKQLLAPV